MNYLNLKRYYKRLRRKHTRGYYYSPFAKTKKIENFLQKRDDTILSRSRFRLHDYIFEQIGDLHLNYDLQNKIPEKFSLKLNYEESYDFILSIALRLYTGSEKKISLDFSSCKYTDVATCFFLKVVIDEYLSYLQSLQRKLSYYDVTKSVDIIYSKSNNVNILLLVLGFIPRASDKDVELKPIMGTGMMKGNKKLNQYQKNTKSLVTSRIVNFFKECILRHGFEITPLGINNLEGIITEILNNCEDHGHTMPWFATGVFFEQGLDKETVGELNINIFNFGDSIYDGFEKTKHENKVIYEDLEKTHNFISENYQHEFSRESLFTLYSLQDGISRLKYDSESRGSGTMKFITSFIEIGDYENPKKGLIPDLTILSGNSKLICTKNYKPFQVSGRYFISLNDESDLTIPPKKECLSNLNTKFPGTLLSVKVYISNENIVKKINENGN